MANVPRHMHILSQVYWEMVDALKKNNYSDKQAQRVATLFFKQFSPLPRESVDIRYLRGAR